MGIRFRKSIKLGKRGRLNISKSGIGASWGIKGARFTKTANGKNRTTLSIPGTGLSYVKESGSKKASPSKRHSLSQKAAAPTSPAPKGTSKKVLLWVLAAIMVVLCIGSCAAPDKSADADPNVSSIVAETDSPEEETTAVAPAVVPEDEPATEAATEPSTVPETEPPTDAPTKPETEPSTEPATEPSTEPPVEAATEPTEEDGREYVLNTSTEKFHYPTCSSVGKIKSSNRQDYFGTRDELIARGFAPCGNCHP